MNNTLLKYEEKLNMSLRELYGAYGYLPFRMSRFEEYDLYVSNKSFLVSDSVITFTDTDGKLLALKPDVTLSIVKNCRPAEGTVEKLYYNENVFRVSRGTRDFREIMQTGLECIGALDTAALAEVVTLAAESLAIIDKGYVLDLSHLGGVGAAIDALALDDGARAEILTALGGKNPHAMRAVLAAAGVSDEAAAPLFALLRASGKPSAVLPSLLTAFADNAAATAALYELSAIAEAVGDERVRIDFSVIHDMSYYSGIVFCGFVPGVASGVLSGGQYDRLANKLCGAEGACGFAVYLDLLEDRREVSEKDSEVFLLYGDGDTPEAVLRAADALRQGGARVRTGRAVPAGYRADRVITLGEVEK